MGSCPCRSCYVGETGNCFETRKKKHIMNVKTGANESNIANHAWSFDHRIHFDNILVSSTKVLSSSFRIRKTLESWNTSATKHADNNCKKLNLERLTARLGLTANLLIFFAFVLLIIFISHFLTYLLSFFNSRPWGRGECSRKFRICVCREGSSTLTLFKDEVNEN